MKSTPRTIYVAGFLFDYPINNVVLIKKTHPDWQAGKYNAVGGKVNENETPIHAMQRQFSEEAGLWLDKWDKFLILNGDNYEVHFFRSFCKPEEILLAQTVTEETILITQINRLPEVIPNLKYLIPMALDPEIRTSSIYLL